MPGSLQPIKYAVQARGEKFAPLYHYTPVVLALKILQTGYFGLTSDAGTDAEQIKRHRDHGFYLSCTRSTVGEYSRKNAHNIAVHFVIDRARAAVKHAIKPVDYWDQQWLKAREVMKHEKDNKASREMEDRIYSKRSTMPIKDIVREVQIYIEPDILEKGQTDEWSGKGLIALRKLLVMAGRMGIKFKLWKDPRGWLTQDPRTQIKLAELAPLLNPKFEQSKPYHRMTRDYLKPYREIAYAKDYRSLSKEAQRLVTNVIGYYMSDFASSLSSNIHNARKSDHAIVQKMDKAMRLYKTTDAKTFAEAMKKKWEPLYKKYNDEEQKAYLAKRVKEVGDNNQGWWIDTVGRTHTVIHDDPSEAVYGFLNGSEADEADYRKFKQTSRTADTVTEWAFSKGWLLLMKAGSGAVISGVEGRITAGCLATLKRVLAAKQFASITVTVNQYTAGASDAIRSIEQKEISNDAAAAVPEVKRLLAVATVDKSKVHQYDPKPDSDKAHNQSLKDTGFWGSAGAGAIIVARDTGRILLSHRSTAVEQPGTWGNFGGAIESGSDPETAARTEIAEECGYVGSIKMLPLLVFQKGNFKYFNFLGIVDREFTPHLGWEAQGFQWCRLGQLPKPLHFGVEAVLKDSKSMRIIQAVTDKTQTIAATAYGYWIDDQGKLIEVPPGGHTKTAKRILAERGIQTDPKFMQQFNESDFVRKYLGWIRLMRDGGVLQIGIWKGRVARKAFQTLRKFINEHDEFTDYSLGLRSDTGGELETDCDYDDLKKVLIPSITKNLVRQVMPESIVQAATRRLNAHARLRVRKQNVRPKSKSNIKQKLDRPLSNRLETAKPRVSPR